MVDILEFIIVGFTIGVVVGALGAGGGILSLPALTYLIGLDARSASVGSLLVVGITALVSLVMRIRSKTILWREGIIFGLLTIVGSALGTHLSFLVSEAVLMTCFALLIFSVSIATFNRGLKTDENQHPRERPPFQHYLLVAIAATCIGLLAGFFGVGGGFMIVPALLFLFRVNIRQAAGTSVLVMVIVSLAALMSRLEYQIDFPWINLTVFAFASIVGAVIGSPMSKKASEKALTYTFAGLLLVISILTLARTCY